MLYSEQAARDNIRNRQGKRVFYLGPGDQLTSSARDFLQRQRVEILPAKEAKKERWALLSGGFAEEKPEDMTHLNGDFLVPKTHPRIVFRGRMDSFQAELILCSLNCPAQREKLEEILAFSHSLLGCEVLEKPVEQKTLCGMTEEQIRSVSHFPQKTYGIAHFMPGPEDGMEIAWLNRARCAAREAELACVAAFRDRDGRITRPDLLKALNRMSSMLYILMIERKAGKL